MCCGTWAVKRYLVHLQGSQVIEWPGLLHIFLPNAGTCQSHPHVNWLLIYWILYWLSPPSDFLNNMPINKSISCALDKWGYWQLHFILILTPENGVCIHNSVANIVVCSVGMYVWVSRIEIEGVWTPQFSQIWTFVCSFYPLFPAVQGVSLDLSLAPGSLDLPCTPDLLLLPSNLAPFVKVRLHMPRTQSRMVGEGVTALWPGSSKQ
jgi:hypothetical protein